MPSNKEALIRDKFNGSEEEYRKYMRKIGRNGGKKSIGGAFSRNPGLARQAALKLAKTRTVGTK